MRSHNTTRKAGNATAEDDSAPALLLHGRHAQLGKEKRRSTIRAPRILEVVHGDICDGLDAGFAKGGSRVVEEDCGRAESGRHSGVQAADLDMKEVEPIS